MKNAEYRWIAREAVARARSEMASGNSDRLPYAALELRYAMEALTYDKARSYQDEIPADVYRIWQPRKVVDYITEIDPSAYVSSSISAGLEEEVGTPAKVMQPVGKETSLTMGDLKAHYEAMGSFLHMPTLRQIEQDKGPVPETIRGRCQKCIAALEAVLASPIWNANFGVFTEIECARCEFWIKKRLKPGSTDPVDARCINCGAEYTVISEGEGKTRWEPKNEEVPCPTEGCGEKIYLWRDELRPGVNWTCQGCGEHYVIGLGIRKTNTDEARDLGTDPESEKAPV